MCSIFKYNSCVGRNFDYEKSYDETFRIVNPNEGYGTIYRIMGMCTGLVNDYPLLYDGINEHGLVCGGLAFEGNAVYNPISNDEIDRKYFDVPSWKFPLKILGNYKTVDDVELFLEVANITDENYSEEIHSSDLHWFIADKEKSIIVEQTNDGLHYYEGSVMTNNPPYVTQNINYQHNKLFIGEDDLLEKILGKTWKSRGKETLGLIGDYTSYGRFGRLSYLKEKLEDCSNTFSDISNSFHLLSCVEQIYGVTHVNDDFEYTIYSIVYDMNDKKAYLKFYDGFKIVDYSFY
jgi:choloylglycine hydrolase